MTGKDLIIYILMNNLEDEPVFNDGKFIGFVTAGAVAMKMNVGIATVHAWIQQKRLDSITIGNTVYIPANFELKGVENNG